LVSGGRSLITRDGDDVVGWDLSQATPQPLSRLAGAASDVFLAIPWVPQGSRRPAPGPEPVTVALTPDLPGADTVPSEIPPAETEPREELEAGEVYVQVTSTQNEGYAKALADQLRGIGFRATVHRAEEQSGGPFKVLVGPYPSRDEAEADGKRLGMPYFITTPAARQP
jgi:cell division protein FtsN